MNYIKAIVEPNSFADPRIDTDVYESRTLAIQKYAIIAFAAFTLLQKASVVAITYWNLQPLLLAIPASLGVFAITALFAAVFAARIAYAMYNRDCRKIETKMKQGETLDFDAVQPSLPFIRSVLLKSNDISRINFTASEILDQSIENLTNYTFPPRAGFEARIECPMIHEINREKSPNWLIEVRQENGCEFLFIKCLK